MKWFLLIIPILYVVGLIVTYNCQKLYVDKFYEKLPNHNGQISTIEYRGHTYIIWAINLGGGILHDPDCKCKIKKGE